jgi:hypothetical protein
VPSRTTPPAPDPDAIEEHLASALGVTPGPPTGAPGPRAWWRGLDPKTRRRLKIWTAAALVLVILASVVLVTEIGLPTTNRPPRHASLSVHGERG